MEWSQHESKRCIDTKQNPIRRSVPEHFPYFHVEFSPQVCAGAGSKSRLCVLVLARSPACHPEALAIRCLGCLSGGGRGSTPEAWPTHVLLRGPFQGGYAHVIEDGNMFSNQLGK